MFKMDKKNLDKGLINRGNLFRLKECMKKAESGERITIGFLGGSITQGSLSSLPTNCYAYLVFDWWVKKFPKTAFTYINAGIGGTTSQFGVARVQSDILAYRPDITIVEFSVNDDGDDFYKETYEGLLRNIVRNEKKPAVLVVNNVCYDDGHSAQEQHLEVAENYDIPCVSMKTTIYEEVKAGRISNREITPDDLHPNTEGHGMLADVIIHFLETVHKELDKEEEMPRTMPTPITKNEYENSTRFQNDNSDPSCDGFIKDQTPQNSLIDIFKKGWTSNRKGASIIFSIEGTGIAVQYRKSVLQPTSIAMAIIDDDLVNAVILDGNFHETWGDCLYIETVTKHTEMKKHKVEIRLIETHKEDVVPFYLVSVIGSY